MLLLSVTSAVYYLTFYVPASFTVRCGSST